MSNHAENSNHAQGKHPFKEMEKIRTARSCAQQGTVRKMADGQHNAHSARHAERSAQYGERNAVAVLHTGYDRLARPMSKRALARLRTAEHSANRARKLAN